MGYNFPNAPATGATFTPSGGPTYTWDGIAWKAVTQGVPVTVYVSDTPPPSPAPGQLWWNSLTGNMAIWYSDPDSAQWVQVSGNVAPAAPVDGNEYVMCNGVWRLKSQVFDLAGKAQQDIVVPAWGPTQMRLTLAAFTPSNTALAMRASIDGTTFLAGATDYSAAGFYSQTGGGTFGQKANTSSTSWELTGNADHSAIPITVDAVVSIVKVSGPTFGYRTRGGGFVTAAGTNYQIVYYQGYTPGANWTAATSLKAVRILSTVALNSGKVVVEWLA